MERIRISSLLRRGWVPLGMAALLLLIIWSEGAGQRLPRRPEFSWPSPRGRQERARQPSRVGEFTFARLEYASDGWGGWTTDYPKADEQFLLGMRHWVRSGLNLSDDPVSVATDRPELFRHPFLYVVEPGQMELSAEDASALREYLLRGGFLLLDDFWGEYEWEHVQRQLLLIFPDRFPQPMSLDHPVFHCYFDLTQVVQVPNYHNIVYRGRTHEKGGIRPSYWGLFDEEDRLMVFLARNSDNGDAWEWIDDPGYPLLYGLAAYKLATNLIVYAMTH